MVTTVVDHKDARLWNAEDIDDIRLRKCSDCDDSARRLGRRPQQETQGLGQARRPRQHNGYQIVNSGDDRHLAAVPANAVWIKNQVHSSKPCQGVRAAVPPYPAAAQQSGVSGLKAGCGSEMVGVILHASRDVGLYLHAMARCQFAEVAKQLGGVLVYAVIARLAA